MLEIVVALAAAARAWPETPVPVAAGCPIGWNGLTLHTRRKNGTPFACPFSVVVHRGLPPGWIISPNASTWNSRFVPAADDKYHHQTKDRSKRPEPFEFLSRSKTAAGRWAYCQGHRGRAELAELAKLLRLHTPARTTCTLNFRFRVASAIFSV